mmetsp:Transcript_20487/g.40883  ORF Transcript_20487/g.40883 Transcript_20487/m.40883 type:complete len:462 (-) Transcript_20487:374-1759(-)|eukprot:CAMPEP_0113395598 /NCGR_PEP_ID=MMETSP0013_2-20120614/13289_1 /TAXON_ID=2843 ORGANISM="Skeletonema costatum, Strain 1716" /NCGR_SAMPLE_ID=MMETSP0013_2 /ASSEMBLY_ACC=CAM_ASM_000158 /LENGTH=461 /DNA_ID=CAMNT_0000279839 /DNA_START=586 /DNA_END=1971 /DNA_ORIENTATION=- /assembly_acc=CAM_ASM_000158
MNNLGTDGSAVPYHPQPGQHAEITYTELFDRSEEYGHNPTRPLDFPTPYVRRGVRTKVLAFHPDTGERKSFYAIVRTEFLQGGGGGASPPTPGARGHGSLISSMPPPPPPQIASPPPGQDHLDPSSYVAYWPQKRLQNAIYGCVIACVVLRRHIGSAADDAARAAGYEPGDPRAPIVWEITDDLVAIKQVEWRKVHEMRGRLLEDPIKEIAAMQLIGSEHPNVLGSVEVLQDNEHLWSVMPFCRGGDLFGVVLEVAERRQQNEAELGSGGMLEPVARYWFRQLLFGLHYLQTRGICHRDLSLENILVDVNHCLVIDMGMCLRVPYYCHHDPRRSSDVTEGDTRRLIVPMGTCGKINYMSPEIFANREHFDGFAVDLWAAGVILYIMVTGFPPYDAPSERDERFGLIAQGLLNQQLQAWEIFLSDEIAHLLQWMLRPNPAERPTLKQVMMHDWVVNGEVMPP